MYLRSCLEGKSHRAREPSDAPETRWAESGESAQTLTGLRPGCSRTASSSPVSVDQIIVVASVEQEARNCPQGLKQQQWTPYPCPDSGEKGSSEKSRELYTRRVLSPEHVANSLPEKAHELTSSRWSCKRGGNTLLTTFMMDLSQAIDFCSCWIHMANWAALRTSARAFLHTFIPWATSSSLLRENNEK
ncbi:hypothetical protein EYF80_015311 [Liparis tanakae]|uniref:Uncharacterized protein n=1 Tax=Liparis tanakae TaxID=230148 RepID=A0A4Z2I9V6_9TELE|nr:hypothetical protein EYF80_015311 [Liparis tanakae]